MRRAALLPATGGRSRRRPRVVGRVSAWAAAGALVAGGLLGCTPPPAVETTASAPPASATTNGPPSTPTPTASPVLVPDGTAADNLPLFRSVVATVWASPDSVRGAAYIDALTAAGFDRGAMQLTSDTTTLGQPAESIQFSVAWRDGCLVGQVGPSTGDPVAAVLPLLTGNRCLIGQTVPVG